ncbi:hypothetical protein MGALJ_19610 [Mycobacterium gallinarum]|uniref:Helix-turn-helix domain-containing protein n=1 Tax=Mycobacterium gallinarum TaxID=39689 RepID=A0A9W4FEP0_9MYCO|nr:helix-turn-helix domain-containing protein [Mycobacterium gallinarum]BBY92292.1 hypothetical protein MGALJ_19610 [Mycobacterium gallinarum]
MSNETAPGNPGPRPNSLNANQDPAHPNTSQGYFVMVPVSLFGKVPVRSIGVYAALRSFACGTESCSPTEADVADRLDVSADTVGRARRDLINAKAITVAVGKGANGGRYEYTFAASGGRWAKLPSALLGRVSPTEIGIYAVLRSFEGHQGCYPKVETLARRAGIGQRQVQRYLRNLCTAKVIDVVGRVNDQQRTTSNFYYFPDLRLTAQLTADMTPTSPQIRHRVDRKCDTQTRTNNQNLYPEQAGWSAAVPRNPLADGSSEGLWPASRPPGDHLVVPGENAVGPGDHLVDSVVAPGESFGDHLVNSKENILVAPGDHLANHLVAPGDRRGGQSDRTGGQLDHRGDHRAGRGDHSDGWSDHRGNPTPEQDLDTNDSQVRESLIDSLVNLMAEKSAALGRNAPNQSKRESWSKSARRILFSDQRDYGEVYSLLDKAMTDHYWSGRIKNLFTFAENYDQIRDEFNKRPPRHMNQERREKRRAQRIETASTPVKKEHVSLGLTRLSDL